MQVMSVNQVTHNAAFAYVVLFADQQSRVVRKMTMKL
jgi:hypothetical protein